MNREVFELRAKRELEEMRARILELADNDWQIRLRAVGELAKFRKSVELSNEAVPALVKGIKDSNDYVGRACISALGDIGAEAAIAIPNLLNELKSKNIERSKLATYALGKIGQKADEIVPVMVELLVTNDIEFRKALSWALGVLGRDTLPIIITSLKHSSPEVRSGCIFAIGNIGTIAITALKALAECLKDESPVVRREACKAIGNLRAAKEVESYVSNLIEAAKDADPEVRFSAQEALRKIGTEDALAVWANEEKVSPASDLIKQLKSDDRAMRIDATEKLVKIVSSEDYLLVNEMIHALKDQLPKVRAGVVESLGLIGEKASEAVLAISNLLNDSDSKVKASAAQALGRIGKASISSVPLLINLLSDKEKDVRMQSAMALEEIGGPEAESALNKFSWN